MKINIESYIMISNFKINNYKAWNKCKLNQNIINNIKNILTYYNLFELKNKNKHTNKLITDTFLYNNKKFIIHMTFYIGSSPKISYQVIYCMGSNNKIVFDYQYLNNEHNIHYSGTYNNCEMPIYINRNNKNSTFYTFNQYTTDNYKSNQTIYILNTNIKNILKLQNYKDFVIEYFDIYNHIFQISKNLKEYCLELI